MRHFYILIISFLLSIGTSLAQKNDLKFEHLSIEQGLSQSSINTILQDSKGFLWFGTLDGLNRYDGYEIAVYQNKSKDSSTLADNAITALHEDTYGRIWVGTQSQGICVYDRLHNRFKTIRGETDCKNRCLSNNFIKSVCSDYEGNVWVGTANGLNKISFIQNKIVNKDKTNNQFSYEQIKGYDNYFYKPDVDNCISNNVINALVADNQTNLWIGTNDGVNKFNIASNQKTATYRYKPTANDNNTLACNRINTLCLAKNGKLWIGTDDGVYTIIFTAERRDTLYQNDANLSLNLKNHRITSIIEDKDGVIWIGTEKMGIKRFDQRKGIMEHFKHDPSNQYSLNVDNILSLFQSNDNVLWVGTSLGGINKWDRVTENISLFRNNPYNPISLSSNQVRTVFEDSEHILWIGTVDGGLNRFDREKYGFTHYPHQEGNSNSLPHNHVRSIAETKDGYLWIGTDGGGLSRFDKKKGTFKTYTYQHNDNNCLSDNKIWKIFVDSQQRILIGTQEGGFNVFDPKTEKFTHYKYVANNLNSLSDNHVTAIYEDSYNLIWVGTFGGGLNRWDEKNQKFIHYRHYERFGESIGSDRIYSIVEDAERNLWIGAKGSLNKFNRTDESFEHFTEDNGLPNNTIMGIIDDGFGNLWISTNRGICKFNKQSKYVKNYNVNDGLQSNEFLVGSFCKTQDGEIWFGGINGLNAFYPQKIKENANIPKIVITKFLVSNNEVVFSDTVISERKEIYLDYNEKDFSFEFVALNYIYPEKSRYAYMMVGKDEKWNLVGNRRFANYTNMQPGTYVFKVKGSNNDEIWNDEGTSIYIYIKPPFWKTKWFIGMEIVMLIALIFLFIRFRTMRLEKDKERLEKNVIERTIEINHQKEEIMKQAHQLELANQELETANVEIKKSSKLKEMFLANTSHEIRTPLNIIIGFTNLLLNTALNEKQLTYLKRIKISSSNLLVIINDILDFSKMEAGKLSIDNVEFDFRELITNVVNAILVKSNEKDIKFLHYVDSKIPKYIYGDPIRLNQILINLAGNAVKFTPEKGIVNIRIYLVEDTGETLKLQFKVIDNGIGMSPEQQGKIFESFTQASSDTTRKFGGTGLGLAIVKRLIELQNGTITVESELDKGSTFAFSIEYEKAEGTTIQKVEHSHLIQKAEGMRLLRILLVDDNPVNRILAADTIHMYNSKIEIDEAENGKVAVDLASQNNYDLIIMDLQMPEMDGFTAASVIRTKHAAPKSQVPILAMSAHALKEEKEKCYAVGMNDYLSKPFVPEELFTKIESLTGNVPTHRENIVNEEQQEQQQVVFKYLDLSVLQKTYNNDQVKIKRILALCSSNIPKQLADLQTNYRQENWKLLRTVSHSLKTSLNYLGLKDIKELARQIEMNAANETNLEEVPTMIIQIENVWHEAVSEIDIYVNGK